MDPSFSFRLIAGAVMEASSVEKSITLQEKIAAAQEKIIAVKNKFFFFINEIFGKFL